ncbi:hypothetical protein AgCh_026889, partial [Apium graveolens]
MSSAASPPNILSVPVSHALRAPLALCSLLILHWTVRMNFAALHIYESRPGPARVVPTTGGEHLSIRSRIVAGSPITFKANFNSPNQDSIGTKQRRRGNGERKGTRAVLLGAKAAGSGIEYSTKERVVLLGGQLCDNATEKAALSCNMPWSQRPYEVVMSFTRSKRGPHVVRKIG